MKLQELISICERSWLEGFQKDLTEAGAGKSVAIMKSLQTEDADSTLVAVYGDDDSKSRKLFNQQCSELYQKLIHFLETRHRYYSDQWMTDLRRSLQNAEISGFEEKAKKLERVFIDSENFEAASSLFSLLREHFNYARPNQPIQEEYQSKLMEQLELSRLFAELENYFITNNIGRVSKTKRADQELQTHLKFYQDLFSHHSFRIQISSRIYWLRTNYSMGFERLLNKSSKVAAQEVLKLMKRKPQLHFNFHEFLNFSATSYQVFTDHEGMSYREFQRLFESFRNVVDVDWLRKMYPRVYQAFLSAQVKFLTEKAGLRFFDDDRAWEPLLKEGIMATISELKTLKYSETDSTKKAYGLSAQARCYQFLGGKNVSTAIELYSAMLAQEQQQKNAWGKHIIYVNLIQSYFLNKDWVGVMEKRDQYMRFVRKDGAFDDSTQAVIEFLYLVARIMNGVDSVSNGKLDIAGKAVLENSPESEQVWVRYAMKHLSLT